MRHLRSLVLIGLSCGLALVVGCGKKSATEPVTGDGGSKALPQYPTGEAEVAAKAEAANRLKLIGKAMHAFEAANGYFPAGIIGPDNAHGLSWRVQLLPYLGEENLYKEFKLNEAWNSPHNKPLMAKMPKVFGSAGRPADPGTTYFQSFFGPTSYLPPLIESQGGRPGVVPTIAAGTVQRGRRVADFGDGTSNTLIVAEAMFPVEWTKPEDLGFESNGRGLPPLPPLGGAFKGGYHGLMADGSVYFFPATLGERGIGAMITIKGGEVLPKDVAAVLGAPKQGNPPPK